jgi:hypothetical protein
MENGTDQANEYTDARKMREAFHQVAEAFRENTRASQEMQRAGPRLSDEQVWLTIFNAVANCHNSDRKTSCRWADEGLHEFRARFGR